MVELLGRYSHLSDVAQRWRKLLKTSGRRSAPAVRQQQTRLTGEQERELVARYQAGERAHVLAVAFNASRNTVPEVLQRAGVARRVRGLSAVQVEQAQALYEGGLSLADVGAQFGVYGTVIRNAFQRAGVPVRAGQGGRQPGPAQLPAPDNPNRVGS